MRVTRYVVAIFLSVSFVLPPGARAQQATVADQAMLDQAVAAHSRQADTDRADIRRMLSRQQIREIASRAGIDVKRAETAIATLDGTDLRQIAEQARAVDNSLAGGQSRVTISTTAIIIGLLVLILIIVAVN
jgi:hypothetical protein